MDLFKALLAESDGGDFKTKFVEFFTVTLKDFFTVTCKDFFVGLLNDKPIAFYCLVAGIAIVLIALIVLIIAIAKHNKAKKESKKKAKKRAAQKKANAERRAAQKQNAAPVQQPVAPASVAQQTAPIANVPEEKEIVVSALDEDYNNIPTSAPQEPIVFADEEEAPAPMTFEMPVYEEPVAEEEPVYGNPYENVPTEVEEVYTTPYEEALAEDEMTQYAEEEPAYSEPAVPYVAPVPEEKEYAVAENQGPVEDDSWGKAKIKIKKKEEPKPVEEVKEEAPVVEPKKKAPKKKPAKKVIENKEPVEDNSWNQANIKKKEEPKPVEVATEEAPAEETPVDEPVVEPVEEVKEESVVEASKTEKKAKSTKTKKTAPKAEEKKKEANESAEENEEDKPKVVGKYVIEDTGYAFQFSLFANNGQLLYESREYASLASCKSGIETFKKNVASCDYRVDVDKNGSYRFIFRKGNSIYIGESYSTAKSAERNAESVKRFAAISEVSDEIVK